MEKSSWQEKLFQLILAGSGLGILAIVLGTVITLTVQALPAILANKGHFFTSSNWDPVFSEFGAQSFIIGTLLTSFLALALSIPFALSIAILLGEYLHKGWVSLLLRSTIDLLASIPSVIYGFWALFVLTPKIRDFQIATGLPPYGVGIFTASIILAIMIIPYAASLSREVIRLVPTDLKEAALSLGATRFEIVTKVILPYAKSGIFAGFLLSLGRALGETMAVTMVIGNSNLRPDSIFSLGNTMASIIANEFSEATQAIHVSSLVQMAWLLLIITTLISIIGRITIKKLSIK